MTFWYAVHTHSRSEQKALAHLARQGFSAYLPRFLKRRSHARRHDWVPAPLFPRYLFLNAIPEIQNLASVRSTRGVVGLVRAGFGPITVPESIITGLNARMDAETGLILLDPVALNNGDKVRIFDGPFVGLEGVLKEDRSETRSLLLLKMLGGETTIEVDSLLLQRVG